MSEANKPPNYAISESYWRNAIRKSNAGDASTLLSLLIHAQATDSGGKPLPGAFVPLPEDESLRFDIVRALAFGPWRFNKEATTLDQLFTRTGWGQTRPRVSDFEVDCAAVASEQGADMGELAADLGLADPDTLRKRIRARKREIK